jgi:PBSX family phage terminase large subunit
MEESPNSRRYNICTECKTIELGYKPQLYQQAFHRDSAKFKGFFGGFGSGKSTTAVLEVIKHILETPNGMTLIGAQTQPQLEQTAMKEFFDWFPKELIENYAKQKNIVDCTNGHRVLFRTLDDETKARSLNLTCFMIEEASEVAYEYFVQLQTRLRSDATKNHMGILSSNPSEGWIKNEFLLKSKRIEGTEFKYHQIEEDINPNYSTHIAPTKLNKYLPPDFEESVSAGKPDWWIRKFLQGSFESREGLVYPSAKEQIIPAEDVVIKPEWERFAGVDFGVRDATVMVLAAVDHETGKVYIYDEYYEVGKATPYHARKFHELTKDILPGRLRTPVADPSGKQRNKHDLRSLFDHYAEYGWHFKPGYNRIEDGIMKVQSYFMIKKLFILDNCKNVVREILSYKYKPLELDSKVNASEKPVDKDNHTLDAMRYLIQELPDDPEQLKNPSYGQFGKTVKKNELAWQLQEDEEPEVNNWYYSY